MLFGVTFARLCLYPDLEIGVGPMVNHIQDFTKTLR